MDFRCHRVERRGLNGGEWQPLGLGRQVVIPLVNRHSMGQGSG